MDKLFNLIKSFLINEVGMIILPSSWGVMGLLRGLIQIIQKKHLAHWLTYRKQAYKNARYGHIIPLSLLSHKHNCLSFPYRKQMAFCVL